MLSLSKSSSSLLLLYLFLLSLSSSSLTCVKANRESPPRTTAWCLHHNGLPLSCDTTRTGDKSWFLKQHLVQDTVPHQQVQNVRGGGSASRDSHALLLVKVGTTAAVEALLMLAALRTGAWLAVKFPQQLAWTDNKGPTVSQLLAATSITLGSAAFGAVADVGASAATQQVLDPAVTPGDATWYTTLRKPAWNPPGWLFPIMWLLIVKPTQAAAVVRILNASSTGNGFAWRPLAMFCTHLALGDAWNKVFFGFQSIGQGAAVITVFYVTLLASIYAFDQVDTWAGRLLWPAWGWISVATALNWRIYMLNKT